jgi:serine/threonine protein kinase
LDAAEDEEALTSKMVGSAGYIPPEVLSSPQLRTPKQDVFACGVMLYEVVASARPDLEDYDPLSKIGEQFEVLDPIVRDAIAPAKQRIATAADFLHRIRKVAN